MNMEIQVSPLTNTLTLYFRLSKIHSQLNIYQPRCLIPRMGRLKGEAGDVEISTKSGAVAQL